MTVMQEIEVIKEAFIHKAAIEKAAAKRTRVRERRMREFANGGWKGTENK